jgi:hypothetical protein
MNNARRAIITKYKKRTQRLQASGFSMRAQIQTSSLQNPCLTVQRWGNLGEPCERGKIWDAKWKQRAHGYHLKSKGKEYKKRTRGQHYLYLQLRDGQGECRQHSSIPGDGVGVTMVIFISDQILDGSLERENGEVPRQTSVRIGGKTKVLARTVLKFDALWVRSTITMGIKRRWNLQEMTPEEQY